MRDFTNSTEAKPSATLPPQYKDTELTEMLRMIVETVGAYGAILWQVERRPNPLEPLHNGRLFILSEWFSDGQISDLSELPQDNSVTGRVILEQRSINVEDISTTPHTFTADPFLTRTGINVLCSVPVSFHDEVKGALNLYRNIPAPFAGEDVARIERAAPLAASVYQATRDKVSINLVTAVNELIEKARLYNPNPPLTLERMKMLLQEICKLVSDSFRCFETSIFLEDYFQTPERYELVATTWQKPFPQASCPKGQGLTGWVLKHAKPVKIFDLINFERDRALIEREYPGISWMDHLNIRKTVYEELKAEFGNHPPPISYMAVPIANGEQVCGVIRCSFAEKIPDHFADRELQLLKLIAAQVGQCWNHWLAVQEEERAWTKLVAGVGELNEFVNKQLDRPDPEVKPIFEQALRVTGEVIKGADILDIRLLDEARRLLRFEAVYGKAWQEGAEWERQARAQKIFSVDNKPPKSAGDYVCQTGKTYVIPDVRNKEVYFDGTFGSTKRMIVAPIRVRNEIVGVLDIRGTGDGAFPEHAKHIAEVLGHLIGLYRNLVDEVRNLKSTSDKLSREIDKNKALEQQRIEIAKNLAHQFNTPIIQAHARLHDLSREFKEEDPLLKDLWAIRGLCGKAKRVSQNMKLFAELAEGKKGKELSLKGDWIKIEDLIKLLIEARTDTQLLLAPRRNIRLYVDAPSFEKTSHEKYKIRELYVDRGMLEQAILNLLDNAAKYSHDYSVIRVYGGWTGKDRFHISFQNKGIKLAASEVSQCVAYGWQSEQAKAVDGSGAGIGLWIVNHVMQAHDGQLVINPTTSEQLTDIKLVFPEKYVR